jgi:hypothetical protein
VCFAYIVQSQYWYCVLSVWVCGCVEPFACGTDRVSMFCVDECVGVWSHLLVGLTGFPCSV